MELDSNKLHLEIMTYRHKLLSHLDEDHEVRKDELKWELIAVSDSQLSPFEPHLEGDKLLLIRGKLNHQWITHMRDLIKKIESRKEKLTLISNTIIGDIEIDD